MEKQVLIIHNDIVICREIKKALKNSCFEVFCVSNLDEATMLFVRYEFCLVIIEAAFSEKDNHHLLKMMRTAKPIPILVLSSNTEYPDRLQAFQAGANAYLGKPYTLDECIAQARSLINLYMELKPIENGGTTLFLGENLVIEPMKRLVFLKGKPIELTRTEFDLLLCLANHCGQVLSREQLYNQVWDSDTAYNVDEVVKSHIKTLRKKLASSDIDYIKNIWGVGYCFNTKKDGE